MEEEKYKHTPTHKLDSEYSKMSFTARNGWKKYVEEVKEDDSRGDEFVSKMVD
jgi:hypothetical protein